RAKQAKENKNIDWKAISHAFRAGFQVRSIFTKGTIEYPLQEAGYLKLVKAGKLDFMEEVSPHLERLMEHLEVLAEESEFPVEVDRDYWNDWLYTTICTFAFTERTR
ncbi:MAG: hypothetical protein KAR06_11260, partial [Deltaproteobacteria bacterium]|nr:hypothetical protein [Deltaproteobacteria bacterium]